MRLINLLLIIFLLLFGISFAALNSTAVSVNFYLLTVNLPVSLLLVLSFGLGMLIGFALLFFNHVRLRHENRKLKSRMSLTEKEVENLRAIPLKDDH